jgi:hypothetical protein
MGRLFHEGAAEITLGKFPGMGEILDPEVHVRFGLPIRERPHPPIQARRDDTHLR